jgi:hypothetical protein
MYGWALLLIQVVELQALDFGPFYGAFGFEAGLEYTDNLENSETNRITNVYWLAGPVFNGGLKLPIRLAGVGGEQMSISTGAAYNRKYSLNGNKNEDGFSAPVVVNTVIPIRLWQWYLQLSDSFTFQNEPLETTVAISEATTEDYNNQAAATFSRNFGRSSINFAASRQDKFSPDTPETEETNYQFSVTPSFLIRENYSIFWATTFGVYLPKDNTKQESRGVTTAIGVSGQLTPYLSGNISVGYGISWLDRVVLGPGDGIFGGIFDKRDIPDDQVNGITSSIGLNYGHPLSPNTTYSISVFRSPGVTAVLKDSNITEIYGVNLGLSHRLRPTVTLSPTFGWVHAEDVGKGGDGEVTDLFFFAIGFSRQLTSRVAFTADYRFQHRLSNLEGEDYLVNQVTCKFRYTF